MATTRCHPSFITTRALLRPRPNNFFQSLNVLGELEGWFLLEWPRISNILVVTMTTGQIKSLHKSFLLWKELFYWTGNH